MKNHIKDFAGFINEMAKGDYYHRDGGEFDPKTGNINYRLPEDDPNIYGLHKGGGFDRMDVGSKKWKELVDSDPDEEMTTAEFIDRHGEEIDPRGRDWLSQRSPDKKMKVWRNRGERETTAPSQATKRFALDTMTTAELKHAKSSINKILKEKDLTPERRANFKDIIAALDNQLKKSKG